jgi:hypothetical protein
VDIQVLSVTLLSITVYGPPTATPVNTPEATQLAPPSILYSNAGSGAVTLIVAVAVAQVVFVVIEIVGGVGAVAGAMFAALLTVDTQLLSVVLRAITV